MLTANLIGIIRTTHARQLFLRGLILMAVKRSYVGSIDAPTERPYKNKRVGHSLDRTKYTIQLDHGPVTKR
jgi:hypothetical protein